MPKTPVIAHLVQIIHNHCEHDPQIIHNRVNITNNYRASDYWGASDRATDRASADANWRMNPSIQGGGKQDKFGEASQQHPNSLPVGGKDKHAFGGKDNLKDQYGGGKSFSQSLVRIVRKIFPCVSRRTSRTYLLQYLRSVSHVHLTVC